MRRLLLLVLVLVPGLALGQTTVKVYTTDSSQTCTVSAAGSCVLPLAGKSTVGFVVTAFTSCSGCTLYPEVSYDNTNWTATSFINPNGNFEATIANATVAAGLMRGIQITDGVTHVRVRTVGTPSFTVKVSASDAVDVDVPNMGTFTSTTQPPMVGQVGGWALTTAPTPTNATLAPLSIDTVNGGVRTAAPAITKGTQGTTGWTVQALKDSGRASRMFTASVASTATAETLITLTYSNSLAATSTCSSCAVTSAKTLRIQSIAVSARNSTGTTASNVTVNLRANASGATTASSPLQVHLMAPLPASAVAVLFPVVIPQDGFEIPYGSAATFGVTITHPQWVTGSVVATFDITIVAFEY